MYFIPQPYTCPKCGYKGKYGPDDPHPAPVVSSGPICPACWETFLLANLPVMKCDIDFGQSKKDPKP